MAKLTALKPRSRKLEQPRWHGELQGRDQSLLLGWCIDLQDPGARVVLELCLNGEAIGNMTADVARPELFRHFGRLFVDAPSLDNCHGFVADMGAHYKFSAGVLNVRVANSQVDLPGRIVLTSKQPPPSAANHLVFGDGGLRLLGWVREPGQAQPAATVRAFLGTQLLAQAQADRLHPALNSFGVGAHGFTLDLPLALADGQRHVIEVRDAQDKPLNGSPITVCCYAQGLAKLLPDQSGLLSQAMQQAETHLPRSLGLAHYAQWAELFETAPPVMGAKAPAKAIGILISGEPDTALFERTVRSLQAQSGVALTVFSQLSPPAPTATRTRAKPTAPAWLPFEQILQQALGSPCQLLACVRAGDTLAPHALAHALTGLASLHAQIAYTDSVYQGQPWFKPAWNADYALGSDCPLELMLVRASLARQQLKGRALPPDAAAFAWRMLAAAGQGTAGVVHVPRVLYQFETPLSAAEQRARLVAAQAYLAVTDPAARLTDHPAPTPPTALFAPRRLARHLGRSERLRKVTLIVPTRDRIELLERCIGSLQRFTDWPQLEIMVVDNDSALPETHAYFKRLRKQGVTVLSAPGAFNFARLNNLAVQAARGDVVGLINNDIEALHSGWLDEMLGHLLSPGVGAVGAKLLWPNGMVQHGGVLLGVGNAAGHFGNLLADADWGDHGRNQLVQQVSAVTAACLLLRKRDYLEVGGMDEVAFPVAFNDVDLCLKLRALGQHIVWTPHARLLHAESASRGHEDTPQKRARSLRELAQLRRRWGVTLLHDPAYHPSLNLDPHSNAFGGLALPPRNRAPRRPGLVATPLAPYAN